MVVVPQTKIEVAQLKAKTATVRVVGSRHEIDEASLEKEIVNRGGGNVPTRSIGASIGSAYIDLISVAPAPDWC